MVRTRKSSRWNNFAGQSAETPFHPVADDGAANLLGDREADPHRLVGVLAIQHQQNEAGRGRTLAAVGGKEIGALLDRA